MRAQSKGILVGVAGVGYRGSKHMRVLRSSGTHVDLRRAAAAPVPDVARTAASTA
jgi:hypothetical protein